MKLILFFGCVVLTSVVISTVHATAEQCNNLFDAMVQMRGHLTDLMEGDQEEVEKLKKFVVYWTNVNVDDDAQLRQVVCRVVSANSIAEMAAALRVPRTHFSHMYMGMKAYAILYKMGLEEMLLVLPSEAQNERRRQAMQAFVNMMNVAESVGLGRFNPPPPPRRPERSGCHIMMQRGLQLYNDMDLFLVPPTTKERLRAATGVDFDDRDHVSALLCKLGEVSDLTELAAVLNVSVADVSDLYPKLVPKLRRLIELIEGGNIPPGIPKRVPPLMLNLLRGMQEVGLFDLTG